MKSKNKAPEAKVFIAKVRKDMLKDPRALKIRLFIHLLQSLKTSEESQRQKIDAYVKTLTLALLRRIRIETKSITTIESGLQLQLILNSIEYPVNRKRNLYGKLADKMAGCIRSQRKVPRGMHIVPHGNSYAIHMPMRKPKKNKIHYL